MQASFAFSSQFVIDANKLTLDFKMQTKNLFIKKQADYLFSAYR